MNNLKKSGLYLLLSILFFYLCWGIPQFFNKYNILSSFWNNAFFSIIYTGIAGCLIPFALKQYNKDLFVLKTSSKQKIIGFMVLLVALASGLILSGALLDTIKSNITLIIYFKYILLFFPMSFGISLFAFLLIPRFVDKLISKKITNAMVSFSLTGIFFFLGFFIDSAFGNIRLGLTMGFLGLIFALSNWFTKNFWATFFGFFITILFNTLAEQKYIDYSFSIVIISTTITVLIILIDYLKYKKIQKF